ncbi:hypothetical protein [Streptomyces microflavus]|uniref:hypothetical protein n=1 Tax=Streptomyces microflavus TaxID=1919 RepID=UPI0036541110
MPAATAIPRRTGGVKPNQSAGEARAIPTGQPSPLDQLMRKLNEPSPLDQLMRKLNEPSPLDQLMRKLNQPAVKLGMLDDISS